MKDEGFSLLEVIVSLAIFSLGLLALLDAQITAIRTAYSALLRAQAQIQIINLATQCFLTSRPDHQSWQQSNHIYFPANQSTLASHHVSLAWQAYQQTEDLSLETIC